MSIGISIPGTIIASKITTGNTLNTFATMDVNEAQGGFMQMRTTSEMYDISPQRRKVGMRVYIADVDKDFKLDKDLVTWIEWNGGSGGSGGVNTFYDIASCAIGNPTIADGAVELMRFIATRRIKLPLNCADSVAKAGIGPSENLSFNLLHNNIVFGSMNFFSTAPNQEVYATFNSSEQIFLPKDVLTIMSPQIFNEQIRDVEWNFATLLF